MLRLVYVHCNVWSTVNSEDVKKLVIITNIDHGKDPRTINNKKNLGGGCDYKGVAPGHKIAL